DDHQVGGRVLGDLPGGQVLRGHLVVGELGDLAAEARLGERADVHVRGVAVDGGQIGLAVAVEVTGGQVEAHLGVAPGCLVRDGRGTGQPRCRPPDDQDGAAVLAGADVLVVDADGQVGVSVAVEVGTGHRVAEAVAPLVGARDARAVLRDVLLASVRPGGRSVDDADGSGAV